MTRDEATEREAIRTVMARYNIHGDRGRVDALAETFTEDGTIAFSGQATTGRAAIAERLRRRGPRNPALTVSRHHLTTSLIEIDGDQATGRTYFQVLTDIGLDHSGVYVDTLVKQKGAWFLARREVRIDWQSPQTLYPPLHVRGVPPEAVS